MNNDNRVYAAGAAAHNRASNQFRVRPLRVALIVVAALLLLLAMPGISHATVTVSRAEVSGDRLRIEGTAAPNRTITVDGVAIGTSDGGGQFRIERTGFMAPADCTVDVNDGAVVGMHGEFSAPALAGRGLVADAQSDDRGRGQPGHRNGHADSRPVRWVRGVAVEQ